MPPKKNKAPALYRAAKFEVKPTPEQLAAITTISDQLRVLWNLAVQRREQAYETHVAPLYAQLKLADASEDELRAKALRQQIKEAAQHPDVKNNATSMSQQRTLLTPLRAEDEAQRRVPRVWQDACLNTVEASFKSYFKQKKRGDPDARRPREKGEDRFQEIAADKVQGFKLADDLSTITLRCKHIAPDSVMTFPIPAYQQEQLRSGTPRKFILFRDRNKRFWISVAYCFPEPEQQPVILSGKDANIVYLSLGAEGIGVSAPPVAGSTERREFVINLWRPDKHWKPKIDSVSQRMKKLYRKGAEKQSRKYGKLRLARSNMFDKLQAQQKQHQREVVQRLLALGPNLHFVVQELVVRSKEGKLADSSQADRRGTLGKNWSAQNTGTLANLLARLKIKASERGSRVETFALQSPYPYSANYMRRKVLMARTLRDQYLATVT